MVLGSHLPYTRGFPGEPFPLFFSFFDGELGVRIFFVISGFIITRLLLDEEQAHGAVSLRLFYLRRALRILPIYFAYLAVLALLTVAGRYADAPSSWVGCLTFTRNLLGRGNSATAHFWSLAVEEQFYLCWPLLFALLRLGRRRGTALAILLGVMLGAVGVRIALPGHQAFHQLTSRLLGARSLPCNADALALGCMGAFLADRAAGLGRTGVPLGAALLLAAEQLFAHYETLSASAQAFLPAAEAATAALLLLSLLRPTGDVCYWIFNRPVVMRIGVLSYSLYVWHFLFLSYFAPRLSPFPLIEQWTLWWIPAALISILSYEFLETPFLKLRRKFRRAPADVPA